MAPLAPPRLSMTRGWPSTFASGSANTRPMMSVGPPGGQGITSLIGFAGYGWAKLPTAMRANTRPAITRRNMCLLPLGAIVNPWDRATLDGAEFGVRTLINCGPDPELD